MAPGPGFMHMLFNAQLYLVPPPLQVLLQEIDNPAAMSGHLTSNLLYRFVVTGSDAKQVAIVALHASTGSIGTTAIGTTGIGCGCG